MLVGARSSWSVVVTLSFPAQEAENPGGHCLWPRGSPSVVRTLPFKLRVEIAPLLYDVSSHCLRFFLNIKCVLPCHIQISHTLNEPLPGSYPLPPLSPRQHTKPTALVSHVSENDIQFAEISLLHRHHQQSGLTAEIDALSPSPTSLRTHPSATAIAYTRGATADTKYMQLAAASYCGVWPRDRGHRCQGVERWRKKEMF